MLKNLKRWIAPTLLVFLVGAGAMPAVIYFGPSPQDAQQASKDRRQFDALNVLASERVAYYTKILAIFTGALMGVSGIQIWFLTKADRRAADAADLVAQQIQLGRDEFNATHRPLLLARDMIYTSSNAGKAGFVQFRLVNAGENRCSIRLSEYWFEVSTPSFADTQHVISSSIDEEVIPTLGSGDEMSVKVLCLGSWDHEIATESAKKWFDAVVSKSPEKTNRIFVFAGKIKYADEAGRSIRTTSFARVYNTGTGRFGPNGDPEREYAD